LVAQPYLARGDNVDDHQDGIGERTRSVSSATMRGAEAERQSMLAEEWEESESIRERMRSVGILEDRGHQSDFSEGGASSSGWEYTTGQESEEEEDDKSQIRLAPKRRRGRPGEVKRKDRDEGTILRRQTRDDLDSLLAILHLALVTMRIPITWVDITT
jgi:hypothetical protein